MAIKESALSLITSIAQGDWVRAVTSAGASRRVTVANLAKAIVESYTGSSLAGSSQSVKSAIDALNSKWDTSLDSRTSGFDMNDFTTAGFYSCNNSTNISSIANYPEAKSNFTLIVMRKGSIANQLLITNNNRMYFRIRFTSGWQPWYQVTATSVS